MNEVYDHGPNRQLDRSGPGLMVEMLRSFLAVAYCLNLSQAMRDLGSTRQTIKRHIELLEELRGERLFEIVNQQYRLTSEGVEAIPEAERIVELAGAWLRRESSIRDGLSFVSYNHDDQPPFWSQQHAIDEVWRSGTPLVRTGVHSWFSAKGQLESSAMDNIRPYLVVYRRHGVEWLCVTIGEVSSYATWLGWSWAKSAIGKTLDSDPMASLADRYVERAYSRVMLNGGLRLDHVYTRIAREHGARAVPISYQRLLMRCAFPNGEYALATLIDRTHNINIAGLAIGEADSMDADLVMRHPEW